MACSDELQRWTDQQLVNWSYFHYPCHSHMQHPNRVFDDKHHADNGNFQLVGSIRGTELLHSMESIRWNMGGFVWRAVDYYFDTCKRIRGQYNLRMAYSDELQRWADQQLVGWC